MLSKPMFRKTNSPIHILFACLAITLACTVTASAQDEKLKALIVDGQNNHGNWPQTTELMKNWLEDSNRFEVEVARTGKKGMDENFAPNFSAFHVVISN